MRLVPTAVVVLFCRKPYWVSRCRKSITIEPLVFVLHQSAEEMMAKSVILSGAIVSLNVNILLWVARLDKHELNASILYPDRQ